MPVDIVSPGAAQYQQNIMAAVQQDGSGAATSAGGAAAVVTLPADAARPYILADISFSYSAAPTGGSLKIEDGAGTTIWGPHPILLGGLQQVHFTQPLHGSRNKAMIITLAGGGGAIVAQLDVNAWLLT
jgi:hypothetical protein